MLVAVQLGACVLFVAFHWSGVVGKSLKWLWLQGSRTERAAIVALAVVWACLSYAPSSTHYPPHDLTIHGYRTIDLAMDPGVHLGGALTDGVRASAQRRQSRW